MEDLFKQTKIANNEVQKMNYLFKKANETNDTKDWKTIDTYFESLGLKYDFNPKDIYIDVSGNINKIRTCYRCGGVANSINGLKLDRVKDNNRWVKWPICRSCWMKKYPYKAKMELLKNKNG